MKVTVKGGNLPIAVVGSKSFKFHQGADGVKVSALGDGWKVDNGAFFQISNEGRSQIIESVKNWLQSPKTIELEIEHSWKAVRTENLKGLGVTPKPLEYEMYNSSGKFYG